MNDKWPSVDDLRDGDLVEVTIKGRVVRYDNAVEVWSPSVQKWTEGVVFAELDDNDVMRFLEGVTVEKGSYSMDKNNEV